MKGSTHFCQFCQWVLEPLFEFFKVFDFSGVEDLDPKKNLQDCWVIELPKLPKRILPVCQCPFVWRRRRGEHDR